MHYDLLPTQWAHWHIRDLSNEWLSRKLSAEQLQRWDDFASEPIARTVPDGAGQKVLPDACFHCPHESMPDLGIGSHHVLTVHGESYILVHHAFGDRGSMQLICDRLAGSSFAHAVPWFEANYPNDLAAKTLRKWVRLLGQATELEPLGSDLSAESVMTIDGLASAAYGHSTTVPVLLYISAQMTLRNLFPGRERIWIQNNVSNRWISSIKNVLQCLHGYSFMPVLNVEDDLLARSHIELLSSLRSGWYDRAQLVQCVSRQSDFNCSVLAAFNVSRSRSDPRPMEDVLTRPCSVVDTWTARLAPGSLQVVIRAAIGPTRTRVSIATGKGAGKSADEVAFIFRDVLQHFLVVD